MAERVVYLNGEYLAEKNAKVSVLDRGFRWGDAVYDATRTFEGRLFKLHEHVERFFRSLRYARIDPRLDKAAVTAICEEVVRRNEPARKAGDGDYLLTMQASRGLVSGIYAPADAVPTVTAYCFRDPRPLLLSRRAGDRHRHAADATRVGVATGKGLEQDEPLPGRVRSEGRGP